MRQIKLEVGNYYRTKNNQTIFVAYQYTKDQIHVSYPFLGIIQGDDRDCYYKITGKSHWGTDDDSLDIVEKIVNTPSDRPHVDIKVKSSVFTVESNDLTFGMLVHHEGKYTNVILLPLDGSLYVNTEELPSELTEQK